MKRLANDSGVANAFSVDIRLRSPFELCLQERRSIDMDLKDRIMVTRGFAVAVPSSGKAFWKKRLRQRVKTTGNAAVTKKQKGREEKLKKDRKSVV